MHSVDRRPHFELAAWAALALLTIAFSSCNKGSRSSDAEKAATSDTRAATPEQPSTGATAVQAATPPAIAARALILQPSFVATSGPFAAGKAVPVRTAAAPSGVVVLSCHHIFGPLGGLQKQIEASALPAFLQRASVADLDNKVFDLGPVLVVPHAQPFKLPDVGGDVSVFQAPRELESRALELAPGLPSPDERIWLVASLAGRSELLHPAVVQHAADNFLVYQFDSADLALPGTSGSPLVNAKGQLVALNLGGGPIQGVLRAFGVPAPSLRRALTAALPSKS